MRKYRQDGSAVEVIGELAGQFLCQKVYEDDAGEEVLDPQIQGFEKVYDTPPSEVYDEQIRNLRWQTEQTMTVLESVRKARGEEQVQLGRLRQERQALEKARSDLKEMEDTLAHLEALQLLQRITTNQMTHYVLVGTLTLEILTADQMVCHTDRKKRRMLAVYVDWKGNVTTESNFYSDRSGTWAKTIPCTSKEEATQVANRELAVLCAQDTQSDPLMYLARRLGLTLPDGYVESVNAQRVQEHQTRIEKLKKELAALEAMELGSPPDIQPRPTIPIPAGY